MMPTEYMAEAVAESTEDLPNACICVRLVTGGHRLPNRVVAVSRVSDEKFVPVAIQTSAASALRYYVEESAKWWKRRRP